MNGNLLQRTGMTSLALILLSAFGLGATEVRADTRPRRQDRAQVHPARRPSVAAASRSLVRSPSRTQSVRGQDRRYAPQLRQGHDQVRYAQPSPLYGSDSGFRTHHGPRSERMGNHYAPRCSTPSVGYVRPPARCGTPTVHVRPAIRYREPSRGYYYAPTVYVEPAVRYLEPTVRYTEPSVYVEPAGYVAPMSYVEPAGYGVAVGYGGGGGVRRARAGGDGLRLLRTAGLC